MTSNSLKLAFALAVCIGQTAFASDCAAPGKTVSFSHGEARVSFLSPDHRWEFTSMGSKTWEHSATLQLLDQQTKRRWNIGSLERNGTVFWSQDSKRLLLRDEYAADDTRIHVFYLEGSDPQEIHGLDRSVKRAISSHLPPDQTTLWVTYPHVCFSSGSSSTILLTVDAPHAPSRGGEGTGMRLSLAVNLSPLEIHEVKNRKE